MRYQYTVETTYSIEVPEDMTDGDFLDWLSENEGSYDCPRDLVEYEVTKFSKEAS